MGALNTANTHTAPDSPQATAVRYLTEHGYEQTTTSSLADAIGMSRSTFFRRFGSKEDVVFADHDFALSQLQEQLDASDLSASATIAQGTLEVSRVLTRDPVTARMRSQLLRSTPLLRERELVITHRYERMFQRYLARVAAPGTPDWGSIAVAAAVVAVHNAALRRWMKFGDNHAFEELERELTDLIGRFAPWFGGERGASRVVVAAFDVGASPDDVLGRISEQLR
ncbi:TetR/AcrR family transcriptional regulator [Leucobacter aridicollis]|uniref:TetR/AcrR family transcriptional regulator n=1 Tax=Leucobacter aridicollis TaxID=283878 RepID=UPI000E64E27E|nr:TetR/AcrR family transcriptional regulator [Leucobacter aridicollis]UTX54250.1 TetR family transcriptional regulator [Leucobacter aridicollis]